MKAIFQSKLIRVEHPEQYSNGWLEQRCPRVYVMGCDEVGRGPIAGPVYAAAVVFGKKEIPLGLDDSKKLSETKREACFEAICQSALAYAVFSVSAEHIDQSNILMASLAAMKRASLWIWEALRNTPCEPEYLFIDGKEAFELSNTRLKIRNVIKGDHLSQHIGAASILAKVLRDREMREWDQKYPSYGFAKHKGYPTLWHRNVLKKLGPTAIHRRSFKGVREFFPKLSFGNFQEIDEIPVQEICVGSQGC